MFASALKVVQVDESENKEAQSKNKNMLWFVMSVGSVSRVWRTILGEIGWGGV